MVSDLVAICNNSLKDFQNMGLSKLFSDAEKGSFYMEFPKYLEKKLAEYRIGEKILTDFSVSWGKHR